ncbi:hypothetical protein K438DRAFT_1977079 [Mycena galopus ATCC 62051]|nr:hypothetical protein K438DRAFT_1977079 [Mycena galopus ATCC 62051]
MLAHFATVREEANVANADLRAQILKLNKVVKGAEAEMAGLQAQNESQNGEIAKLNSTLALSSLAPCISGPRYTCSRSPSPAASHSSIKRQRSELATIEVEMGPLGPFALGSTLTPAEIFALHVTTTLPSYPIPHEVKQVDKYLRIKLSSTDAKSLTEAWGRHTVEAYRDIKCELFEV